MTESPDQPDGRSAETFRTPRLRLIMDVPTILMGAFFLCGMAVIPLSVPLDRLEKLVPLLVILPGGLGMAGLFLGYGVAGLLASFRRYELGPDDLHIRGLLRSRTVPWRDVADFAVRAKTCLTRPDLLMLYTSSDSPVRIPLRLEPNDRLRPVLAERLPMVTEQDLDREREAPADKLPSIWRLRLRQRFHAPVMVAIALYVLLIPAIAGVRLGSDYFDYRRIVANPVEIDATVVYVYPQEGQTDVAVKYDPPDRDTVRLIRTVRAPFTDRFRGGDRVVVQYLAANPEIGRIKDWDADRDQAWQPLLCLAFGVFLLLVIGRTIFDWIVPLRHRFVWEPSQNDGHWTLDSYGQSVTSIRDRFPMRHRNAAVIVAKARTHKNTSLGVCEWSERLEAGGIPGELVADRYLVLGPEDAAEAFDRLSHRGQMTADYCMVDAANIEQARTWLLTELIDDDGQIDETAFSTVRFYHWKRRLGPLNADDLVPALDAALKQEVRELLSFKLPDRVLHADLAEVLDFSDATMPCRGLLQFDGRTIKLWLQPDGEKQARCAIYDADAWQRLAPVKPPRTIARQGLFDTMTSALFMPFHASMYGAALVLACLLYYPLQWLLVDRSVRRNLIAERRKALAASASDNPAKAASTEDSKGTND